MADPQDLALAFLRRFQKLLAEEYGISLTFEAAKERALLEALSDAVTPPPDDTADDARQQLEACETRSRALLSRLRANQAALNAFGERLEALQAAWEAAQRSGE